MKERILRKSWLSVLVTLPTEVELSKKRRGKYYKKHNNQKVPKKYQGKRYRYLPFPCSKKVAGYPDSVLDATYGNLYLTDTETMERCISNPRVAGKPRTVRIGGNLLYSGGSGFTRKRVMECIKGESEWEIISRSEAGFPSYVFAFWKVDRPPTFTDEDQRWDFDNQVSPYNKALLDECQNKGFLPEDHSGYLHSNICSFLEEDMVEGKLECVLCFINKNEYELL